ncbi:MAG: SDR family oxidoreductase [Deltaproteobacteria bacterium]|nr:SDR family oxidoreductase [Deltaproteobacteria bacterium]MBI3295698.1 SDR family oxidoreductase [Deltaproteobacteria bacterium]
MSILLPNGRYLVTGGAGFIGSHLCETLLQQGCEVIALDNFITGSRENVRHLLGNRRFTLLEQDLIDSLDISGGFAGVFHMASPASPVDYAKYPIETLRVGSLGTDHVLDFAVRKQCRILVASTSEVYGDPKEHPQKETYWGNVNPIGPRGCYDESKRYLEAVTMAYHRVHALQTRIVRIFNTFGPRMRVNDGRVVPNFCIQARNGTDITVYGDGSQTRSFCYVSDNVEGLLRLFCSDYPEPVNIGNPLEMTILQFAQFIIQFSGSKSKIVFRPLPVDDPKVRKPDIALAKRLLDWSPRVSLEEGLKHTYEYFGQVGRST